jgi:hypothetical protein
LGQWLSKKFDDLQAAPMEKAVAQALRDRVFPILTRREGQPALEDDIHSTCANAGEMLRYDAPTFRAMLPNFPKGDSLKARFEPDGKYVRTVENQFRLHASAAARQCILEYYRELRGNPRLSLPAVSASMRKVRKELAAGKATYEKRQGSSGLSTVSLVPFLDKLEQLERDKWLLVLRLRGQAIEERKRQILRAYERAAMSALSGLKGIYQAKLLEVAIEQIDQLITQLESVVTCLTRCHDPEKPQLALLSAEYTRIVEELNQPPRNTRYLYSKETAEQEIDALVRDFNMAEAEKLVFRAIVGRDGAAARFDEQVYGYADDPEQLTEIMFVGIIRTLLGYMRSKNITRESASQWNAELKNLVRYSAPYVEFETGYEPLRVPGVARQFVFAPAKSPTEIDDLLLPHLPEVQTNQWQSHALDENAHRMIFYCEEPGYSATFMSAFKGYESVYNDGEAGGAVQPARYWSDRRWIASSGPDTGKLARREYLTFLLKTTYEVLDVGDDTSDPQLNTAARAIFSKLFRYLDPDNRRLPFFEMPSRNGVQQIQINLDDAEDYDYASERFRAAAVIPYLQDRIKASIRQELKLDEFTRLCENAVNRRTRDRAIKKDKNEWLDADEREFRDRTTRIRAYSASMRKTAWEIEYSPEDWNIVKGFQWMNLRTQSGSYV